MANNTNNAPGVIPGLTQTQTLNLQLAGVQVEIQRAQAYITQLQTHEADIRQRLFPQGSSVTASTTKRGPRKGTTASASTATPTNTGNVQRRRKRLSPEHRQKMRDAAKKRWAKIRGEEAAQTTNTPAAPVPEAPLGMQETLGLTQ